MKPLLLILFAFWVSEFVTSTHECFVKKRHSRTIFPGTEDYCKSARCVYAVMCSDDLLSSIENADEIMYFGGLQYESERLPADIFAKMTHLEYIELTLGHIKSLEVNTFDGLSHLKGLCFRQNQISTLPQHIFDNLTDLRYLEIWELQLTTLPQGIFSKLHKLSTVRIVARMSQVNGDLFHGLTSLQHIMLDINLEELPHGFFADASELKTLSISGNGLKSIRRDAFKSHPNLKEIYAENNKLTEIEEFFLTDFPSLQELNLAKNQVLQLPKLEKNYCPKLRSLDLRLNNISGIPEDVLRSWLTPPEGDHTRTLVLESPTSYWLHVAGVGAASSVQLLPTETLRCVMEDTNIKKDVAHTSAWGVPSDNKCYPCGSLEVGAAAMEFCVLIPCSQERSAEATFKDWREAVSAGWKSTASE